MGDQPSRPTKVAKLRIRSGVIVASLALMLLLLGVTPFNDFFVGGSWMAGNHLPPGIVVTLVLMSWVVCPLVLRISQGCSVAEKVLMAAILLPTAGLASSGLARHLIPLIAAPLYFAKQTPELLPKGLPSWLYLSDVNAVRTFYENAPLSVNDWAKAWLTPLLAWGILVGSLWVGCWLLTEPLWQQWAQRERFAFPISLLLYRLLTDDPAVSLKRQKLFWFGVVACAIVHGINLINTAIPSLPSLPLRFSLTSHLIQSPWSALAPLELHVYPSAIGMGFLIAGDVALSFASFYWLAKLQRLISEWLGWQPIVSFGRGLPVFVAAQQIGALLVFALSVALKLWHLACEDLFIRRRLGAWLICCIVVVTWSWWVGIPMWLSVLIPVGYFALAIAVAWAVTNAGLLFVQTTFLPAEIGLLFGGTHGLSAPAATALALQQWALMFNFRDHPLPHLLHGRHLAHLSGLPADVLQRWQGVSLSVGSVGAAISFLATVRRYGALRLRPFDFVQLPQTVLRVAHIWHMQPLPPQWRQGVWVLIGAFIWRGILGIRALCQWIPHPIGWLFAESYAAQMFWFSFMLGTSAKFMTLRYGGLNAYQRLCSLFAGMVVGDTLMLGVSIVTSWFTPIRYAVLPT